MGTWQSGICHWSERNHQWQNRKDTFTTHCPMIWLVHFYTCFRFFLCFWFRKKYYSYKYTPKIHLQTALSNCYDSKGIKNTLKVNFDFFITIMLYHLHKWWFHRNNYPVTWVTWQKMCIRESMLILGNNYCSKIT